MVYLPVKFRRGSVHFPRRYSPHNPDVHLVSHYGVHIFSGSFLRYCCRSPLCPALRTASPRVPVHCLAHIFPACSVPLVLGQRVLLVSPASRMYFGCLRSVVKLEKSSLSSLCPLSPHHMVPSSQILAMSIFLCHSSHFPGCIKFNTLSASLLSDDIPQHHDSYTPTLEC